MSFGMLNIREIAIDLLTIERDFYLRLPKEIMAKVREQKLYITKFQMKTFEQEWSDTSGGFQSGGGRAMTTERTYVFISGHAPESVCIVFFGSRFAYAVPYSRKFLEDVKNRTIHGMSRWQEYLDNEEVTPCSES